MLSSGISDIKEMHLRDRRIGRMPAAQLRSAVENGRPRFFAMFSTTMAG
jgi:hypothetical protein